MLTILLNESNVFKFHANEYYQPVIKIKYRFILIKIVLITRCHTLLLYVLLFLAKNMLFSPT